MSTGQRLAAFFFTPLMRRALIPILLLYLMACAVVHGFLMCARAIKELCSPR